MKTLLSLSLLMAYAATSDETVKKYIGTWNFKDFTEQLEPEQKEVIMDYCKDMYVSFSEDMTYEARIIGNNETGKWSVLDEQNKILMVNSEGNERKVMVTFLSDDEVSFNMGFGGFLLNKVKEKKEDIEEKEEEVKEPKPTKKKKGKKEKGKKKGKKKKK